MLVDALHAAEGALLGDPVRNATVTADDTVTVLRLRRADVLALVDAHGVGAPM